MLVQNTPNQSLLSPLGQILKTMSIDLKKELRLVESYKNHIYKDIGNRFLVQVKRNASVSKHLKHES